MSSSESSNEVMLERLAEEFIERHRCGECPSLSEYIERFPALEHDIRDLFPALVQIEQLKPAAGDLTGPFAATTAAGPPLVRLGEYRIVREIGRGNMGIVYEAEQETLGRRVALKVLPRDKAPTGTYLERFRREGRSAGRLHHTNIVPVFGVGEAEGHHYYTMQFIPGEGLDRVLADLRRLRHGEAPTASLDGSVAQSLVSGQFASPMTVTEPAGSLPRKADPSSPSTLSGSSRSSGYHQSVARIGVQVAEALAYAHGKGVYHRDIKPSNLLLDAQGTVWITDFGLARHVEDGTLSRGDIVGTLRYMAPERFAGDSLPQSDLYALGLTLYELLTLRPAFDATDQVRLMGQILDAEPPRPRTLEPTIPPDLETIVLKAMARDPEQRYASGEALAEDLRRFLADRPIRARRSSWREQTWRWCRRNPAVATLSAAVLVLLTVTAVGGVFMSLRLGALLRLTDDALQKAQEAEREGKKKLFASYVSDADATRMSGRPGQRFGALRRIREALEVAKEVGLSDKDKIRLRNIALAALCLPDVEPGAKWTAGIDTPCPRDVDPVIHRRLQMEYSVQRLPEPAWELRGPSWYSPDGRFLAAARQPYIAGISGRKFAVPARVWRLDGPKPVSVLLDVPEPNEQATAFRPDSRQVAFGHDDGTVSLYDLKTGKLALRLKCGSQPTFCLAYHPTLQRIAVGNGPELTIWDTEKGHHLIRITHTHHVSSVAWHPRGHRLATGAGRLIHLWEAETGKVLTKPWRGQQHGGISLAFNRAGDRVASNDWGVVLRLRDAVSGQLLLSVPEFSEPLFGLDDQSLGYVGTGQKHEYQVRRHAAGRELRVLYRSTPRGREKLFAHSIHPNGRLLVFVTETGLGFLDILTGEELGFVAGTYSVWRTFFDRTGSLWTSEAGSLIRWPVRPVTTSASRWRVGPPEWVASLPDQMETTLGVSRDGQVAAFSLGRGARVVHRGSPRRMLQLGPQYDVRYVDVSPDGRWVITKSHWIDESSVRWKLWNANTGRLVRNLPYPDVEDASFSADSRWLYVSGNGNKGGRLEIASLAKTPVQPVNPNAPDGPPSWPGGWRGERMRVGGVFAPDGKLRAFGSDRGHVSLVRVETDEEIAQLPSPEVGRLSPIGFSPDGTLLLASGEEAGALYVYDLRRLRSGLAELGLDWNLKPYPPAKPPEEANPALAPRLQVELVDAEWATSKDKIAEYERRKTLSRLYLNPRDADAHARLSTLLYEAGKLHAAHAHLSTALAFQPGMDTAYRLRGEMAARLNRWGDAVADLTLYLDKYPDDGLTRIRRAHFLYACKRYTEAAADLTTVIHAAPFFASLYERRAACYEALGKADLAKADREKSLQLAPNDPTALNNQAWHLVTGSGQRDPARALELIARAIKRRPNDPTFLNTLGVVQYRNGNYAKALVTLEKSLAAGAGRSDAFDLYFLAMCHARLGDPTQAKDCFARAVKWTAAQKNLPPQYAEELKAFRAEAEELLRQALAPK